MSDPTSDEPVVDPGKNPTTDPSDTPPDNPSGSISDDGDLASGGAPEPA